MSIIVKFENGNFAIRKGSQFFGYRYLDVDCNRPSNSYWWTAKYKHRAYLDTLEQAQLILEQYKKESLDYGTPV